MDLGAYFKGKRITVMGLGLLGRGAGDVAFLAEEGADLIVTDLKTEAELAPSVERLKRFPNIMFVLGQHREEDFMNRDFILKGPAVPLNSPYIACAKKEGIPIKMSASWFVELSGIPAVGITGTRGKTTTTYMLKSIMEGAGMQVLLGGNVRGVSTLALVPQVTEKSIALLELDSWQCWGFGEAHLSPNVAVFTNFMPDHLNFYRGNMDAYLNDKVQIFLNQSDSDTLVIGVQAQSTIAAAYGGKIRSTVVNADPNNFPKSWQLSIPGAHNRANATCALEAARALGIDDEISRGALESFTGVSGRLELVREINGVKIYNDTTATTPEATLAALKALKETYGHGVPIVLIMGGSDKGLDMSALMEALPRYTKEVMYLTGTGTERIAGATGSESTMIYHSTLAGAVAAAVAAAVSGDLVLFSPAFASFGMFKNEFDRGEQFMALVKAL